MTVLETTRTRLRQLQPSDTDNVLKIFSDARAMAFAPRQATDDPAVARDFIDCKRGTTRSTALARGRSS